MVSMSIRIYECAWSCVMHWFFQRGGLLNSKRRQRLRSKEGYVWCNKRPSLSGRTLTYVDNIGQHLVFKAGQLLNSCLCSHRNKRRWLASEPPSETICNTSRNVVKHTHYRGGLQYFSGSQSNILSRPGSLCRFLRSDRISKASTTWQHGKTVENLYLPKDQKPLLDHTIQYLR